MEKRQVTTGLQMGSRTFVGNGHFLRTFVNKKTKKTVLSSRPWPLETLPGHFTERNWIIYDTTKTLSNQREKVKKFQFFFFTEISHFFKRYVSLTFSKHLGFFQKSYFRKMIQTCDVEINIDCLLQELWYLKNFVLRKGLTRSPFTLVRGMGMLNPIRCLGAWVC